MLAGGSGIVRKRFFGRIFQRSKTQNLNMPKTRAKTNASPASDLSTGSVRDPFDEVEVHAHWHACDRGPGPHRNDL